MPQVPNLVKSDLVFNERLTEFSVDIYTYFSFAFVLKKDPKLALRISFDSHGITLAFLS